MPTSPIHSPDDPRLKLYVNTKDRDVRRETGLFLAEGEHVVRRAFAAVAAGTLPSAGVRSVLVVASKVDRVEGMIADAGVNAGDVEVLVCSREVMERAVGMRLHQGIIAAVEPPAAPELDEVVGGARGLKPARPAGGKTIVVCPEITNTENLGLLVRVCAGLGVGAMVLGPRCCDPWYRRAVRVSMGAVFAMPMVRSVDLEADLDRLRETHDYELVATVIDDDAEALRDSQPFSPDAGGAILLGSEGYGLPADLVARCDRKVRIPMHAGVDSLNVAVAAGIVVHHFCR
ncbi:MAG: RNA methyltransferase [Planctomycetota bacterium]